MTDAKTHELIGCISRLSGPDARAALLLLVPDHPDAVTAALDRLDDRRWVDSGQKRGARPWNP